MQRFIHRHQPSLCVKRAVKGALGALVGLAIIGGIGEWSGVPLLMAPLAASAVLLFAIPESPLSQPINVIGGHMLSTGLSIAVDHMLTPSWYVTAITVAIVIAALGLLRLSHPPAGANPLVVMTLHPGWDFLFTPMLIGSVVLVASALAVHTLPPRLVYPLPVKSEDK